MPNYLYFLISIVSFTGISIFFSQRFNIKLSFGFLFSYSIIICILFILGTINFLTQAIFLTNLIGSFYFLFFVYKNYKKINYKIFKSFLLTIFILVVWFIVSNFLFLKDWDEFYWGQFVKAIFYDREIWDINSSVLNIRWLPGVSLFQVFFIYFNESYCESTVIFVTGLIFFISIFSLLNLKNTKSKILSIYLILIVVFFLDRLPGTLYLEIYLSSFFVAIFSYLVFGIKNKNEYIIFPFLLIALALMKIHGLFLSIIMLILFYIKIINKRSLFSLKYFPELYFLLILFLIYLTNSLWTLYLENTYLKNLTQIHSLSNIYNLVYEDIFVNNFNVIGNLINFLNTAEIFNNKGRQLFSSIYNFLPSILGLFFILIFINIVLDYRNLKTFRNKSILKILFYFGFIGYLILPYFYELYLQSYSTDDSFSGTHRYSKIYILSLIFLIIYEIVNLFEKKNLINFFLIFIISISLISYLLLNQKVTKYADKVLKRLETQKNFYLKHQQISKKLKKVLKKDDKVFYINYGTDGYEAMSFRYHLAPIQSNNFNFSIGPKLNANDIWTFQYKNNDFINALNEDAVYDTKIDFIKSENLKQNKIIKKKYISHIFIENTYKKFYYDYNLFFKNKKYDTENILFKILRQNSVIIGVEEINFN